MSTELDSMYFGWLYAKVVHTLNNSPYNRFYKLMKSLYGTEFVWQLSGDDNRAEDGTDLRREFLVETKNSDDSDWRQTDGCSMLEMLIALSRRCEFQTEETAHDWFWEMLENLELSQFNDGAFPEEEIVADILDDFNWRRYRYNGTGGIFPIEHPSEDQRSVEIWYQFHEYLADQDRLL
jgi:hypothetical protein